jgi:hypothetical protein
LDGTWRYTTVPEEATLLTSSVRDLSLGPDRDCALESDGSVHCWELRAGVHALTPTAGFIGRPRQIAVGGFVSCVSTDCGVGECWGLNFLGGLGDGTTISKDSPTPVHGIEDAAQLSVGSDHVCARRANDAVVCWGGGQVLRKLVPGVDATSIGVGCGFACGLANAAVACWGPGLPPLAGGRSPDWSTPILVDFGSPVSQLAVGWENVCVLGQSGGVKCFGRNGSGAAGTG